MPGGACIRDDIHISDLARADSYALRYSRLSPNLNCGFDHGLSVREEIETVKRVSGVDFKVQSASRLRATPPRLERQTTGRASLGWQPQFDDLFLPSSPMCFLGSGNF
jgi:UDP-glucose 4-epimerase